MSAARERQLTGRHVLAMLAGFFGLMLTANGAFVYFALDSWSGLETEDAYRRGLTHNQTLDAAAAQQSLGWQVEHRVRPLTSRTYDVTVTFHDRTAAPIDGLAVAVTLRRPTNEGQDMTVTLSPAGPGVYRGDITPPLKGQWDLRLAAESADGIVFRREERLWLK